MADKKISELPAAPTAMTVNDLVPMVQDGYTVKASLADLLIQAIGAVEYAIDLSGMNAKTLTETPRLRAAPASASAPGTRGEWAWDSNYIYLCTALNTWKRVAIATW